MKQNSFLRFIFALIPGVGFMYNGLIRKGIEVLVLFMVANMMSDMLGLGFIGFIAAVAIWFYSFFKTFEYSKRIERGEYVEDTSILFGEGNVMSAMNNNSGLRIFAIILIIFGAISLINKVFAELNIYYMIRGYMVPVIFIAAGAYILFKRK